MNTLGNWGEAVVQALGKVWANFVTFVPKLIGALVVLTVGIFIAIGIAKIFRKIINAFKITNLLQKMRVNRIFEKAGLKFDVGEFCYWFVKWFLLIVFFMAAAEIVNLTQVSQFLAKILFYVPNVLVAVLIMLIGIVLANFLAKVVNQSAQATTFSASARFLATLTRWSILVFSLMTALIQLKVAVDLIRTLLIGVVAMVAIAGGIAFGLGGKGEARKILKKISQMKNKRGR